MLRILYKLRRLSRPYLHISTKRVGGINNVHTGSCTRVHAEMIVPMIVPARAAATCCWCRAQCPPGGASWRWRSRCSGPGQPPSPWPRSAGGRQLEAGPGLGVGGAWSSTSSFTSSSLPSAASGPSPQSVRGRGCLLDLLLRGLWRPWLPSGVKKVLLIRAQRLFLFVFHLQPGSSQFIFTAVISRNNTAVHAALQHCSTALVDGVLHINGPSIYQSSIQISIAIPI